MADVTFMVPLIATIAYIPLFVILLTNRPLGIRHKLFLLFLITAVLWSFTTFLSRMISPNELNGVRIVICLLLWMLVQLHYFIRSFYQHERVKIPSAYVFVIATIILAWAVRNDLFVYSHNSDVHYGPLIIALVLTFLLTVGVKDVISLRRQHSISPDPAERNQISYLLVAVGVLTVFISLAPTDWGQQFPVSHIGNLIVACVLTYAVVTHRLADMRVVFRQAIVNVVLYGGGLAIVYTLIVVTLQQWLDENAVTRGLLSVLAVIVFLGMPATLYCAYKVRDLWQKKVEGAFIGARYSYRKQLSQFITRIHDVNSLEQLGSEFISLIAQSFDCRRACLLLPQAEEEGFTTRFTYPPSEDNPLGALKLGPGSPIPTWLERENTILPERNLAIFPEFQSMWAEEREEIQSSEIRMFVPLMN